MLNTVFQDLVSSFCHANPGIDLLKLICPLCLHPNSVPLRAKSLGFGAGSGSGAGSMVSIAQAKTSSLLKVHGAKTVLNDLRSHIVATKRCPFVYCEQEDPHPARLYLVSPLPTVAKTSTALIQAAITACLLEILAEPFLNLPSSCLGSNQRGVCFVEHCIGFISIGTTSLPSISAEDALFDLCRGVIKPTTFQQLVKVTEEMSQAVYRTSICTIH